MPKLSELGSASADLSGGLKDFLLGGPIRGPGNQSQATSLEALGRNEIGAFNRSGLGGIRDAVFRQGRITDADVTKATGAAQARASGAFATSEGILERAQRGQGVNEAQRKSQAKRLNLRRALSQVDASNRAVAGLRSQRDIARTGAGQIRDVLFAQAAGAQEGAAEAEGERNEEFLREQAEAQAARAAGIGQVGGVVASFFGGG